MICVFLRHLRFEKTLNRKRRSTLRLYFCDSGETRTPNLLIRSQMHYPLCYGAIALKRCKYTFFF